MNFVKWMVLVLFSIIIIYLLGGIGYYNWDTILYTSKIANSDLASYVSFGRPILYLLGFAVIYPALIFNSNQIFSIVLSFQSFFASIIFLMLFAKILRIKKTKIFIFLIFIFYSLPTFFIISTSFLPEIFMLLFSYAFYYLYLLYIQSKNNKYLYYQLLLLFVLAGIREYFAVAAAIMLLHLIWTKRTSWKYIVILCSAVVISILIYYVFLPYLFNVKYFKVRFSHISSLNLSEISSVERLEEIWNSIKYNFNILLLIPALLLFIYQKKKGKVNDLDKLFIILFFSSFALLLLYGDIYTYRRYTAILIIPIIYFLYEAFIGLNSKKLKLIFLTGLLLNFLYTLCAIGAIINHKKEIKVFINEVDYLITNNNNELVFYSDFRSLEYALLEYHFNAILKNEIIIQQQDELNTDLIRNSKKKFLISSQPEYFLINKIKFRKYSNRIYEVIE